MRSAALPEIHFSEFTLTGYLLTGLVYILLPLTALYLMRRSRTVHGFALTAGILCYLLSTRFNDIFVQMLFSRTKPEVQLALAVLTVGIFEEGARFLAVRFPLCDIRCTAAAVCYGIGHGGAECIIRAVHSFQKLHYGLQCNRAGAAYYTDGKTPERAEHITELLRSYADQSLILSLFQSAEAAVCFCVHIALTLLIFKKSETEHPLRWLAAAILLHSALNDISNSAGVIGGAWSSCIAGLLCGCGILALIWRILDGRSLIENLTESDAE